MRRRQNVASILIKNIQYSANPVSYQETARDNIKQIYVEGGIIKSVNGTETGADEIIDASNCIVLPGFVNCHHHFFQSMMRTIPEFQSRPLQEQINVINEIASFNEDDDLYICAKSNCAELIMSGCTTTVDNEYLIKKNQIVTPIFKALKETGLNGIVYISSVDSETFNKVFIHSMNFSNYK